MEGENELTLGELLQIQSETDGELRKKINSNEETQISFKKRTNKNRPREQSSKISIKHHFKDVNKKHNIAIRDPRFDSLCGEFNEKIFRNSYSFVDKIKEREKEELEHCLKKEIDSDKQQKIKYLLKRMKDQQREKVKKAAKEKKIFEETQRIKKRLIEGKPVHFKTKAEKKLSELVDRYEELKSKGKVQSYMKKKLKKTKRANDNMPFK